MVKGSSALGPAAILSLCVPTYNRSRSLNALLRQLAQIKEQFGDEVEICVSDNHSEDDTPAVIDHWQKSMALVRRRNQANLGFSGNVDCVIRMATGRWMCLVGDDDLLIAENVTDVLATLRGADPDYWIILPVTNRSSPKSSWLSDLDAGTYSPAAMRLTIWRKGVSRFGFIGCHLISAKNKSLYQGIPLDCSDHWIHQNYWFIHLLARKTFLVGSKPLVQVNPDAPSTKYTPSKWATLWSQRLVNFSNVARYVGGGQLVLHITLIREIVAWSQGREWIKFHLRHPRTSAARLTLIGRKLKPATTRPIEIRATLATLQFAYRMGRSVTTRTGNDRS